MKKEWLAIVLLLFVFSCKKKDKGDDGPGTPAQDIEMQRITRWKWLVYKVDVGGVDFWKLPGVIESCTKDNTYRFYRDSVLTQFENSEVCSGATDSSQSEWRFIDGRKKVMATLFGLSDTANVVSLGDSTMQLGINYQGSDAVIYFKKK